MIEEIYSSSIPGEPITEADSSELTCGNPTPVKHLRKASSDLVGETLSVTTAPGALNGDFAYFDEPDFLKKESTILVLQILGPFYPAENLE